MGQHYDFWGSGHDEESSWYWFWGKNTLCFIWFSSPFDFFPSHLAINNSYILRWNHSNLVLYFDLFENSIWLVLRQSYECIYVYLTPFYNISSQNDSPVMIMVIFGRFSMFHNLNFKVLDEKSPQESTQMIHQDFLLGQRHLIIWNFLSPQYTPWP